MDQIQTRNLISMSSYCGQEGICPNESGLGSILCIKHDADVGPVNKNVQKETNGAELWVWFKVVLYCIDSLVANVRGCPMHFKNQGPFDKSAGHRVGRARGSSKQNLVPSPRDDVNFNPVDPIVFR
jgi:hypothetical protein